MRKRYVFALSAVAILLFGRHASCTASRPFTVQEAIASEYPLPLELSPDGSHLLYRTLTSTFHQGLAIEDLRTKHVVHMPQLPGEAMRAAWAPDSRKVAFYLQPLTERQRRLYVWDSSSNSILPLKTVGQAETAVLFSPNGRSVLTIDEQSGITETDVATSAIRVITRSKAISAAYSPDSRAVCYVEATKRNVLLISRREGQDIQTLPQQGLDIDEVKWQPDGNLIALRFRRNGISGIATVRVDDGHWSPVFSLTGYGIDELNWVDKSTLIFVSRGSAELGATLYVASLGATVSLKTSYIQGRVDVRGIASSVRHVGYIVRSSHPTKFVIWSIDQNSLATRQTPSPLPTIPGSHIALPGAFLIRGIVWTLPRPKTMVVRFHGRNSDELPVWQPDIQFYLSHNVEYLSLQYDTGKADDLQYEKAVIDAIASFANKAGIKPSDIVLVGFSAGADFVLGALYDSPVSFKAAIVWGLNVKGHASLLSSPQATQTPFIILQASQDIDNKIIGTKYANNFRANVEMYQLDDTHLLTHPQSWIRLQDLLQREVESIKKR